MVWSILGPPGPAALEHCGTQIAPTLAVSFSAVLQSAHDQRAPQIRYAGTSMIQIHIQVDFQIQIEIQFYVIGATLHL